MNREILLLRVPRWLHSFIYKYWFSYVSLPYLPALTTAFCYEIVWGSWIQWKTERSNEGNRGDLTLHPTAKKDFLLFSFRDYSALLLKRKHGQRVSSMTRDTGQPGILLVLVSLSSRESSSSEKKGTSKLVYVSFGNRAWYSHGYFSFHTVFKFTSFSKLIYLKTRLYVYFNFDSNCNIFRCPQRTLEQRVLSTNWRRFSLNFD